MYDIFDLFDAIIDQYLVFGFVFGGFFCTLWGFVVYSVKVTAHKPLIDVHENEGF